MKIFDYIRYPRWSKSGDFFIQIFKKTGVKPKNKILYKEAFTHSSVNLKNNTGNALNYERLEFLGDAVLNSIVAEYLFFKFPSAQEGQLTKLRAKIVSRSQLNTIGKSMGLYDLADVANRNLQIGENIHGNLLESLVGAMHVDWGYKKSKSFIIQRIIEPHIDMGKIESHVLSYKAFLIEWGQKEKKNIRFETDHDNGLDPDINYFCELFINNQFVAKARGLSKKKAEEKVARIATNALKLNPIK